MDCLYGLRQMKDDSVHITITSPPYNLGKSIHHNKQIYLNYDDSLSDEEYKQFIIDVINELLRVTKHYVFFNFQILSNNKTSYIEIMNEFKNNIKEFFIWAKTNPPPPIQQHCFASGFEFILCLSKTDSKNRTFERCSFNAHLKGQKTISNTIIKQTNKKFVENHFACFPEWLPYFFIKNISKENDIVLDPFMGSGTTAVVCKQLNRRFIGFEINPNYCKIAEERLSQRTMFDVIGENECLGKFIQE